MSAIFEKWTDARICAERKAERTRLDVAVRKVREYGKVLYAVSLASRNDSDYTLAEIVRPLLAKVEGQR